MVNISLKIYMMKTATGEGFNPSFLLLELPPAPFNVFGQRNHHAGSALPHGILPE